MNIQMNRFPGGKSHCLTMSYDDTNFPKNTMLLEIFNRYGIKATFHMNGIGFEWDKRYPEEFQKEYAGHEISCHCYTHPFLGLNPKEIVMDEIIRDRQTIEPIAGYPMRGLSYPFASVSPLAIETLKACGMEYGRTARSTHGFGIPQDFMNWDPTCHHNDDIAGRYETFITPAGRDCRLYYIWGHAHEFPLDNNWDMMERFCEKAAKDADKIWFATNIEIVDYVNAMRRLIFALDGTSCFNPSGISVWVTDNKDNTYEIRPGYNKLG